MDIVLQAEAPPLRQDSSGGLRIGKSRVLLELVIHAFEDGATPEAIAQRYPTATLADIYSVLAYFLRHQEEIKAYLAKTRAKGRRGAQTNRERAARFGRLAERLLARQRTALA